MAIGPMFDVADHGVPGEGEGILSGNEIRREVEAESILIDPFDKKAINPASIDLTLGGKVAVYKDWVLFPDVPPTADWRGHPLLPREDYVLDVKKQPEVFKFEIPEVGLVLWPGVLYLMHTEERVSTDHYVPVLDGKSSIGRLGIMIHLTAGYGDPGFDGQYTLEVTTVHPVRVYAGMRFCQMRFHTIRGAVTSYQRVGSHYRGKRAEGPVASKIWETLK